MRVDRTSPRQWRLRATPHMQYYIRGSSSREPQKGIIPSLNGPTKPGDLIGY